MYHYCNDFSPYSSYFRYGGYEPRDPMNFYSHDLMMFPMQPMPPMTAGTGPKAKLIKEGVAHAKAATKAVKKAKSEEKKAKQSVKTAAKQKTPRKISESLAAALAHARKGKAAVKKSKVEIQKAKKAVKTAAAKKTTKPRKRAPVTASSLILDHMKREAKENPNKRFRTAFLTGPSLFFAKEHNEKVDVQKAKK
jgi:hypothetical protein